MQTLKGKAASTATVIIAAMLIGAAVIFGPQLASQVGFQAAPTGDSPAPPAGGGGVNVYSSLVTLRTSGVSPINGTNAALNGYLYRSSDNARIVGETSVPAAGASLTTTLANNFDGFIMLGNDGNFGTDRGVDYYFRMVPVKYTGQAGDYPITSRDMLPIVAPTFTFYDDGTAEATANVTVGSGAEVVTSEIKISVTGSDGALGNPDPLLLQRANALGLTVGNRPLAICVNETAAGLLDKARPNTIVKSIPSPGILSGRSNVECNVLDTEALIDGLPGFKSEYRFGLTIASRTGQNPGITASSRVYLLDLTWAPNDQDLWVPGWEDASEIVADTEIGLNGEANTLLINYT